MSKITILHNENEFYIYNKKSLISLLRTEILDIKLKSLLKYKNKEIRKAIGLSTYYLVKVNSIREAMELFNQYKLENGYSWICNVYK